MQKQNENLKVVHTINKPSKGWKGYTEYINKDVMKKEILDYKERTFYVCGPPKMVEVMENLLKEIMVPQNQIKKKTSMDTKIEPRLFNY